MVVNSERGVAGGLSAGVELVGGLAGAGHPVTLVCHPSSVLRDRLADDRRITIAPVAIRAELNVWRAVQIAGIVRRIRPDVILADRRKDVKLAFAAGLLRPGTALVHRHGAPSPLRNSAVYRAVWTRIDAMIVNSAAMRDLLLANTPWISATPIAVIHNGKDLERWCPRPERRAAVRAALKIPDDAFVACYHGVLQKRKNVDVLLRALGALGAPDRFHALVIGAGPRSRELHELAARVGVQATFTGARSDVPDLLAAADVAVHLSSAEGFSNSVIEALACGLPVIASAVSSHPEQVESGVSGVLVPLDDERAVAAAVERLASDSAGRHAMAAAARLRAEAAFGIDRMIERYALALAEAIGRRRGTVAG